VEHAAFFVYKLNSDSGLQGELMQLVGGLLSGGNDGGLNLGALLGWLTGDDSANVGATGGGDLLQTVVKFAENKGFSFVKDELQKALGSLDIVSLLSSGVNGGGGLLDNLKASGIDLGSIFGAK
jgi:hypothetical protein